MQFRLLHFYMKVNKLVKQATVKTQFTLQIQLFKSFDLRRFICTFIVILYQPIFCANLAAKLYWVIDQWAGNGVDSATNKCGDLDQKVKAPSEENDKSKAHKLPVLARWN